MSRIDDLRKNFKRVCGLPWDHNVAGPQKVWIAVYDKDDERKLRIRLGLFEETAASTDHDWRLLDLTNTFAEWFCNPPHADFSENYFEQPSRFGTGPTAAFKKAVAAQISETLRDTGSSDKTVVALFGIGSLFGFLRLSEILPLVEDDIRGRLLVFFPGVYEQNNYRLLDARDGWNYHAVPITAGEGEARK